MVGNDQIQAVIPRLRRYARALTGERIAADDLVQDTLERAWNKFHLWRPGSDLRAWLFAIMHNVFINQMRSRRHDLELAMEEPPSPAVRATQADGIEVADLDRALQHLSIEHREVLLLVGLEQMKYEEVSQALGIPVGTVIHAVEIKPGGGAKIARSAGSSVQLVAKDGPYAQLRMPSGEIRNVDLRSRATIGEVGNAEQSNINWGKAGRMRWKGKRPTVRGVAMNPVDHPHGGGEGKTSGGRHPVNPAGKPEGRTRKANKASDKFIVRRRKTGKKR